MNIQADFIRSSKSKYIIFLIYFAFLASSSLAQTGVINNGAKIIVNAGAVMKITGTGADYTNNTSGSTHGRIDLDGTIELEGDWANNATVGNGLLNVDSDGEAVFNGSSTQFVGGPGVTGFENIKIDNTTGLSLSSNVLVYANLELVNGYALLNNYNLTLGGIVTGGPFSASKMVITNGSGALRKSFTSIGTFTFPIGENTGVTEYSPVDFTLNSYSGLASAWVGANVTNTKHPENNTLVDFTDRYWTLTSAGITSPNYDADFNYLDLDINGTETSIYAAEYSGALRILYSPVDAPNNQLEVRGLSTFAEYTGVDGTSPTVDITSTETSPTNATSIPVTITFSEVVTGFALSGIDIVNGTGVLSTVDSTVFTLVVTPTGTNISVNVNASVAMDHAGNENESGIQFNIVYDGTNPGINNLYPVDDEIGIPAGDNLQLAFDENVVAVSGNIVIYDYLTDTVYETIDVTSGQVTGTSTITVNPSVDLVNQTHYYVLVDATAFDDEAGNSFAGISSKDSWDFTTADVNNPVISDVSPVDGVSDVSTTSNLVITFNEDVSAVALKYITIWNATLGIEHETVEANNTEFVTIVGNIVTINPTTDFDGNTDYYILMDAGAFEDIESNPCLGISSVAYWNFKTEDIAAPKVDTYSPLDDANYVLVNSNLVLTFNENVSAVATKYISIMNSTLASTHSTIEATSGLVNVNNNIVTINPSTDFNGSSDYYILIDPGAFIDDSGNEHSGIIADTTWNFTTEDNILPTVNISSTEPDPTTNSSFDISIVFSEEVTGFDLTDIVVGNGAASNFSTSDNITFTATITPSAVGSVTVDINSSVAFDLAGNPNMPANQYSIQFNGIAPNVLISTSESDPTNVSPISFDIVFTLEVKGFELSDIEVTNATASNLVTSDSISFTVDITPDGDGLVSVFVPSGVSQTSIGNNNNESNTAEITYDSASPTVVITSSASGTVNGNFDVTITFSETVTGFTSDDVSLINGSIVTFTESTVGQIWTVTISPENDGDVTINVNAGSAQDAAGNDNLASNTFTITYESGVGINGVIPYELNIFADRSFVILEFTNEGNYEFKKGLIEVYNLLGQKMLSEKINDFNRYKTKVENSASQIYVVRVVIDEQAYIKRLFIK